MTFFDSELRVMEVLWTHGSLRARQIADILKDEIGWNVNTTYTVIKKCIRKGAIERTEPGFACRALVTREEAQLAEADELIGRMYDGSASKLFSALIGGGRLSKDEIAELKNMVAELEDEDQ